MSQKKKMYLVKKASKYHENTKIKRFVTGGMILLCSLLIGEHYVSVKAQSKMQQYTEPEVLFSEPDGKEGYYVNIPEVKIKHRDNQTIVKYELTAGDGRKKEGSLEMSGQTAVYVTLKKEDFAEGDNLLRVWTELLEKEPEEAETPEESKETEKPETPAEPKEPEEAETPEEPEEVEIPEEPEEPEIPELFSKEWHFLIDTKAPEEIKFFYNRAVGEEGIYVNEPLDIRIKGTDTGSGVKSIRYTWGDGTEETISGAQGSVNVPLGFEGVLRAYCEDRAGNRSKVVVSEKILYETEKPEINIEIEGGDRKWYQQAPIIHVKVNDSSVSAGLQSLKCYCDGKVVALKKTEEGHKATSWETEFSTDGLIREDFGLTIVIEATDRAGNFQTWQKEIYVDGIPPEIELKGIPEAYITGKPVETELVTADAGGLAEYHMFVQKMTSDGKWISLREEQKKTGQFENMNQEAQAVSLSEDGIYRIEASGVDFAGNHAKQNYRITVDQTNPVIRYVEQMHGSYVPYFQWNYRKEEMISDFTEFSYKITLNGCPYIGGTKVFEEGRKILEVEANDAAGNRSVSRAVFFIDHTPPEILVQNVTNGETYEESAEMGISLGGKGEVLREITVNGENINLGMNSQFWKQNFEEAGKYEVNVSAQDLAGNQAGKQISFAIKEKKVSADGKLKKVTKIFSGNKKAEQEQKMESEDEEQRTENRILIPVFLAVVIFAVVFHKMRFE